MFSACCNCQHHIKSREEAGRILKHLIAAATLHCAAGGRTGIEATLSDNQVMILCLWDSSCEDCEDNNDAEVDKLEQDSQWDLP